MNEILRIVWIVVSFAASGFVGAVIGRRLQGRISPEWLMLLVLAIAIMLIVALTLVDVPPDCIAWLFVLLGSTGYTAIKG